MVMVSDAKRSRTSRESESVRRIGNLNEPAKEEAVHVQG